MDENGTNSGSPASPIWLIYAMSTVAARAHRDVHSRRYGVFFARIAAPCRSFVAGIA
jgi:hypothetical protein